MNSLLENMFINSSDFEEFKSMAENQGYKVKSTFKPKYNEIKGINP